MDSDDLKTGLIVIGFLVLFAFLITMGPIFTIWSLNALFFLNIPVNFTSWCAVLWLTTVLNGIRLNAKRNN